MTDWITPNFESFHARNPHVYRMFRRFALEMHHAGYAHGSAGLIFERMRWELMMQTTGPEPKLNNNYRSRYARKFEEDHPNMAGFFRKRRLRAHSNDSTRFDLPC